MIMLSESIIIKLYSISFTLYFRGEITSQIVTPIHFQHRMSSVICLNKYFSKIQYRLEKPTLSTTISMHFDLYII